MTNLTGISVPSLKIFFTFIIKAHGLDFVNFRFHTFAAFEDNNIEVIICLKTREKKSIWECL